jgi:inosine-uridine nucleoside N-ribohydrolase
MHSKFFILLGSDSDVSFPYYSAYKKLNPSIKGASIHDLVVMSALVNPEYFKYLYREVEINVKTFF